MTGRDQAHEFGAFVPQQGFQEAIALSPDGMQVAYSSNASGQFNLYVQPVDDGAAKQLTAFTGQAVRRMAWAPDGASLVFLADQSGDEQHQVFRISATGGEPTQITSADAQHELGPAPFSPSGRLLACTANDRDPAVQELVLHHLADGQEHRRFTPPEGVQYAEPAISPNGRWIVVAGVRSNVDIDCYLIDLSDPTAEAERVTDGDGFYLADSWTPDSTGFYLRNVGGSGQFKTGAFYSISERGLRVVVAAEWDVEQIDATGGGLLWSLNEDGCSVPYIRQNGEDIRLPLPKGMLNAWSPDRDGTRVAVLIDAATRPAEVGIIDVLEGTFRYLTDTRPAGLRAVEPVEPHTVNFTARDGRRVSGLLYRPRGEGPFPLVLSIHGGPDAQERPQYLRSGLYQYLLARGIALYAPNIAGSTGFGQAFQELIYRDWGGIDLRDLEDALGFLGTIEGLDTQRIAPIGGSYGGFAVLSCLARIDHRWAAGVSICGPSNLVSLSANCPPTWRHYVDRVLGNPEADAAVLTERSPITYAAKIVAPLLVFQGANDPRVPRSESDQIVEELRARGVEVRYRVFPDEGHGFTSRTNEISACTEMAEFIVEHLKTGSSTA